MEGPLFANPEPKIINTSIFIAIPEAGVYPYDYFNIF